MCVSGVDSDIPFCLKLPDAGQHFDQRTPTCQYNNRLKTKRLPPEITTEKFSFKSLNLLYLF